MVGMLDWLLANHLRGPAASPVPAVPAGMLASGGFQWPEAQPQFGANNALVPQPEAGETYAPEAEAARAAAAKRTKRSVIHPYSPHPLAVEPSAPAQPSQNAGDYAGLADAFGSAPPPTNDPTSAEPKPDPAFMSSQGFDEAGFTGSPLSLAPKTAQDDGALPPGATSTEGRSPAAAAAPAGGGILGGAKGFLDKLLDPNKAATWLALGAGFSGAPSLGTGMRRAFSNAVPAMASDRAQMKTQEGISATYRALVAKGVPSGEALAAATNPVLMKAVADKYFDDQLVPHEIGVDMLGNKIMGSFHKRSGKYYDVAGREVGAGGAGAPAGATANVFAKGVTEYNSDLGADEYKAQFSPEVQAQMDAYINGDQMPTGNPRLKGLTGKVKEWAQTYGAKKGIPVSDATFSEKRKFRTELGSTSPSTIGGQAKAFNQGIEHATALAGKLEELHNVDPVGIPAVAQGANYLHQAFSTKQTGIAKEAAAIGQTLAGEVGKLFSGNAGGGVHERELTRQRFNTITSPKELAGALEATLETMEGGLAALETQKVNRMGTNSGIELVEPKTRENMDKIRATIKRLRGDADAPPAAPKLKAGESTTINGVTIRRLN